MLLFCPTDFSQCPGNARDPASWLHSCRFFYPTAPSSPLHLSHSYYFKTKYTFPERPSHPSCPYPSSEGLFLLGCLPALAHMPSVPLDRVYLSICLSPSQLGPSTDSVRLHLLRACCLPGPVPQRWRGLAPQCLQAAHGPGKEDT